MARHTRLFDERDVKQIQTMAGLGMTSEQMAAVLGVSKSTFDRRQADQTEVSEAVLKGRALTSMTVRQTAYQMAVSGESPALTIFWLKCREQWKEPREEQNDNDAPIALSYDPTRKIEKRVVPITQKTGADAPKNSGALTDGKGKDSDK